MNFIEDESPTKLRGAYYTHPRICAALLSWVGETRPLVLLEPSCGDGAFFAQLAAAPSVERVIACEIEPAQAALAAARLSGPALSLHVGDFLAWALDRLDKPPEVDAVVGNPPFVRYQYLPPGAQDRAEQLHRRLGLPFTRHTNAWVPFLVAALQRLRPGGRLGMVVPSELLHVLHAQAARTWLREQCARVLVLDPEELWFEGALQGVVLLLAEKKGDPQESGQVALMRVRGEELLQGDLHAKADWLPAASLPGKWTRALLAPGTRALLAEVEALPTVRPFDEVAHVEVGIVTGANQFFVVPDAVVAEFGLEPFARPMFGRSAHVPGLVFRPEDHEENRRRGLPTSFLHFDDRPREALGEGPARYLAQGEAQGLDQRYKCRVRAPWYQVPSVRSAPMALLKRCHDHPRLVLNAAGALTTDTAYRVRPKGLPASRLVASFLGTLTALSAELEGRHYGGGVLELVPSEIRRLLLPLGEVGPVDLDPIDAMLRAGTPAAELLAWQDAWLLPPLGLSRTDIALLAEAWQALRQRRQRVAPG